VFGSPADWQAIPPDLRSQIVWLDSGSTKAVYTAFSQADLLCGDDGWGNRPFSDGCFQSVTQLEQQADDWQEQLAQFPIAAAEPALILTVFGPADEPAILTTWQVVLACAAQLFGGDNLVVVDLQGNWCLYYHHDGVITFAE
jgi:hypothetical protein